MTKKTAPKRAGRPKKDPATLMDVDIRVPVTKEQRDHVKAAAALAGEDLAQWARTILFRAADKQLDSRKASENR